MQEHKPIFINPDYVERVRLAADKELEGTAVIMGGKALQIKEAIDEVVAALTSSTLAARLAAKI